MSDTNRAGLEDDPHADLLLRPPWQDEPDETDTLISPSPMSPPNALAPPLLPQRSRAAGDERMGDAAAALLAPFAAAQNALARLDALAEAAPDPIRRGLIARLALHEAAGWLAARHAWVHPHDLALREAGLAGRFDTAAQIARPRATLPNTLASRPGGWDDPEELSALAQAEAAATRALALARLLTALPRRHDPLATSNGAAAALGPLGAGDLDAERFVTWQASILSAGMRGRGGLPPCPTLPPLLHAGEAALAWMESGVTDQPDSIAAMAIAALLLARSGALQAIPLPFWAAWPALGQAEDSRGLPRLRPAVARDLAGTDRTPWAMAFVTFTAAAARMGLHELDRLRTAAAVGHKLAAGRDKRTRLPGAIDLALAAPVVTPRALAKKLSITPQAANRLLASLESAGVVREVTGRGSFRAFAV